MALGDILSGLAAAAGGVEQGVAQRRELERRARMDLMAQQLQSAQIGNLQSEEAYRASEGAYRSAEGRRADAQMDLEKQRIDLERRRFEDSQVSDSDWATFLKSNPSVGSVGNVPKQARGEVIARYLTEHFAKPTTPAFLGMSGDDFVFEGPGGQLIYRTPRGASSTTPPPTTTPPSAPPPKWHLGAPITPSDSATVAATGPAATPTAPPRFVPRGALAAETKTTPKMLESAEFGTGALAQFNQIDQIRKSSRDVENEVGRIVSSPAFIKAIPFMSKSEDAVKALAAQHASAAAQRYMRAKWSFLDNIVRTRIPGGRMSGALFEQLRGEFMPGLDTSGNSQVRFNEIQAIISAQGESGFDQNPQLWTNAAKRHGVGTLNPADLLNSSGGSNSPINPRFDPR